MAKVFAVLLAPELLAHSTATVLAAGVSLGPYRVESELGEGGMGEVSACQFQKEGRRLDSYAFGYRMERKGG